MWRKCAQLLGPAVALPALSDRDLSDDDLPVYRIDGEYVRRLDDAPGSREEKAAEIEAALEYEIKVGGGEKNPVKRRPRPTPTC